MDPEYSCYKSIRVEKKESRAIALYGMAVELNIERMAEDGDRYACTCIGRMYRRTSYKHYSTTVKWFRKAAEQGYANAQFHLGHMYELGWGVDRNDSTTVEWYRKAAEQGYANAQ